MMDPRDTIEVGTLWECVRNDYIPRRAGTLVRITQVGKSFANAELLVDPTNKLNGDTGYRLSFPTRQRDWVTINPHCLAYTLPERGEGLEVEWERVI